MKKYLMPFSVLCCLGVTPALADVTVGVTLSATGPAASLGAPERNMIALLPKTLGGEKVVYIVLDDATDPTAAAKNATKLTSESNVDVIIGSSTVPTAMSASRVAAESKTPIITMAPIRPPAEIASWIFQTPQAVSLVARAVVKHMKTAGVQTLGFIGYNDPYGEAWWTSLSQQAEAAGIKIVASERYNRADTSVIGQALKLTTARPDVVFIGASGMPAAYGVFNMSPSDHNGLDDRSIVMIRVENGGWALVR